MKSLTNLTLRTKPQFLLKHIDFPKYIKTKFKFKSTKCSNKVEFAHNQGFLLFGLLPKKLQENVNTALLLTIQTNLDLTTGFHHIEVDKNDIPKTTFSKNNENYKILRTYSFRF